ETLIAPKGIIRHLVMDSLHGSSARAINSIPAKFGLVKIPSGLQAKGSIGACGIVVGIVLTVVAEASHGAGERHEQLIRSLPRVEAFISWSRTLIRICEGKHASIKTHVYCHISRIHRFGRRSGGGGLRFQRIERPHDLTGPCVNEIFPGTR